MLEIRLLFGDYLFSFFPLLGICSATVTSTTWAATITSVEITIASISQELTVWETMSKNLSDKVMEAYCT